MPISFSLPRYGITVTHEKKKPHPLQHILLSPIFGPQLIESDFSVGLQIKHISFLFMAVTYLMRGKDSSSGDMLRHTNDMQTWLSFDSVAVRLLIAKQETNAKSFTPVRNTAQTSPTAWIHSHNFNAVIILMKLLMKSHLNT